MSRIPITILSGFLGSGKTTFLSWLLSNKQEKKIAIIQNEFGAEIGLEGAVVTENGNKQTKWIELPNGCICCTVKDDLLRSVESLVASTPGLDLIFVETTGVADPQPVIETFWVDEELDSPVVLDGVVVFIDLKHIPLHLDEDGHNGAQEARKQISMADVLVMNKTDLVSEAEQSDTVARLAALNPFAKILFSSYSKIPVDAVLNLDAYSPRRPPAIEPLPHNHDSSVSTFCLRKAGALDFETINSWIATLLWERGMYMYRMKGLLNIAGESMKFSLQAVHQLFTLAATDIPWAPEETRGNTIVFIGQALDETVLSREFQALPAL